MDVERFGEIAFRITGSGPVLHLVGAPAGIAGYQRLAAKLADRFTVVTHDPRGVGASSNHSAVEVDPKALASDLCDLIEHIDGLPVHVFGSSGGAVTILALLQARPDIIGSAVLHEPPLFKLLPDADSLLRHARRAFEIAIDDPQEGMQRFVDLTEIFHSTRADDPRPGPIPLPPLSREEQERQRFALGRMAGPTVEYEVPSRVTTDCAVFIAAGEASVGQPAGRAAACLADRLSKPLLDAPGNHLGPFTEAARFGDWLARLLIGGESGMGGSSNPAGGHEPRGGAL